MGIVAPISLNVANHLDGSHISCAILKNGGSKDALGNTSDHNAVTMGVTEKIAMVKVSNILFEIVDAVNNIVLVVVFKVTNPMPIAMGAIAMSEDATITESTDNVIGEAVADKIINEFARKITNTYPVVDDPPEAITFVETDAFRGEMEVADALHKAMLLSDMGSKTGALAVCSVLAVNDISINVVILIHVSLHIL